jgi:hypothetical protein
LIMKLTRLALITSVLTSVVWTAKAIAIAIAGGLGRSPVEGPLFLVGLVTCVVAAAVTGMAVAHPRSTSRRVFAAAVGIVAAAVYGTLEGALVSTISPAHPGWVWGELNLWVLMLTILALAVGLNVRGAAAQPAPTSRTA